MSCSSGYTKEVGEEHKRILSPVLHWHNFFFVLIAPEYEEDLNKVIQAEDSLLKFPGSSVGCLRSHPPVCL